MRLYDENLIEDKKNDGADEPESYSKWQFFKDYYLKYIIGGIIAIIIIIYVISVLAKPRKDLLLEGSAVNAKLTEDELYKLNEGLFNHLGGTPEKEEVIFVDEFTITYGGSDVDNIAANGTRMNLMNYTNANVLDYLIVDEDALKDLNRYDMYLDVRRFLDDEQMKRYADKIVCLPYGVDLTGRDIDKYMGMDAKGDNPTVEETASMLPLAIDISDSKLFDTKREKRMYVVFPTAYPHVESLSKFIDYLYE